MVFDKQKYSEEWRKKNKEKIKEYREKNKDRIKEQKRKYRQIPSVKQKRREYQRELVAKGYYKEHYKKNKDKYYEYIYKYTHSKHREKYLEYHRKRNNFPGVKDKRNLLRRQRLKNDESWRVKRVLYGTFRRLLNRFQERGEIGLMLNTKRRYNVVYGIDFEKIINKLFPLPSNLKDYEVDHIIPLINFDFTKKEDISKAYNPENIRLISKKENQERRRL